MFCYDCGVIYITVYHILLRYKYSISTVCSHVVGSCICILSAIYLSICYLSIYLSAIYLSALCSCCSLCCTLCSCCSCYCTPQTSASPIMSVLFSNLTICSHLFKIVKSLTLDITSFDGILCLLSIETRNCSQLPLSTERHLFASAEILSAKQ